MRKLSLRKINIIYKDEKLNDIFEFNIKLPLKIDKEDIFIYSIIKLLNIPINTAHIIFIFEDIEDFFFIYDLNTNKGDIYYYE